MNLTRRYKLFLFLTIGAAIISYCVSEWSAVLALITIPAWAASWFVARRDGAPPIPKLLIAAFLIAATAHTFATILQTPEDLIAAISRYIVWLLLIKLYDRVSTRDLGQMLAMSLFLVLGACMTSNSVALGMTVIIYLPLALWTIMLHQIHVGEQRAHEHDDENICPSVECSPKRLRAIRSRRDFRFLYLTSALATIIITTVVFMFIPRRMTTTMMGGIGAPPIGSFTAFQDEVRLGDEGFISESTTPVFEMRVFDEDGENAADVFDRQIRMRGAVLSEYRDGQWLSDSDRNSVQMRGTTSPGAVIPVSPVASDAPLYRQEITFRNEQSQKLFAMHRAVQFSMDDFAPYSIGAADQTIGINKSGRFSYTVISQAETPTRGARFETGRQPPMFRKGAIHDLAEEILANVGMSRDLNERHAENDAAIASAFEAYLQSQYRYTLEMLAPNVREEPIEMFLLRTKRGHCEYFASGMAALCRSIGIDARVVTGYMAIEYDEDRETFLVRESHAHAWMEALVAPGLWQTFDPSPPGDIATVHEPKEGLLAGVRSLFEAAERFWVDTVVGYDQRTQNRFLGEEAEQGQAGGGRLRAQMLDEDLSQFGRRSMAALTQGVLAFAGVFGVGLIAVRVVAFVRMRLARKQRWQEQLRDDPGLLERQKQTMFYAEFLRALARAGMAKPAWRPPMQHAQILASRDFELAEAAASLTDLYYCSKFGRQSLSAAQVNHAGELLEAVQRRLRMVAGSEITQNERS